MDMYYMDLHIHIGASAEGKPVKITASRSLTFENIIKEVFYRKGIDIIGIIDCASPPVIKDIKKMIAVDDLVLLPGGGYSYREKVTVFLGAEVESKEDNGGMGHFLAFFPDIELMAEFSSYMAQYITNITLSSQMTFLPAREILNIVQKFEGIMIPAHAFTPHKSIYGNCAKSLKEIFPGGMDKEIKTIELGLSADAKMADHFSELESRTFLSNSDAHSLSKIGREYNLIKVREKDFKNVFGALAGKKNQGQIIANYGLDPRLGKYHRSFCEHCELTLTEQPPQLHCPQCGNFNIIKGVWDRIVEIRDKKNSLSPEHRPPYHYQIPLEYIPGIGKKTIDKLIEVFGSEMYVLHKADFDELKEIVPLKVAENIVMARKGRLVLLPGGGGKYGKAIRDC